MAKSKDKPLKSKTKCQIAGWGQTEQENVVNDLLVTDVSPINSSTCQTMWKKVNVNLPNNVLCAGGYETKSGACQVHLKQYFGESSYSVSLYSSDLNKNVSGINLKCIVIAGWFGWAVGVQWDSSGNCFFQLGTLWLPKCSQCLHWNFKIQRLDQRGDQRRCLMPMKMHWFIVQYVKISFYGVLWMLAVKPFNKMEKWTTKHNKQWLCIFSF